jgi:hexulose-6-phosphate isomerase
MKISCSYWMFEGGLDGKKPIIDAFKEAKEAGFDAVELAVASSGVLTPETTKAECEAIVAAAKQVGVEIASLASGEAWGASPTAGDAAVRAKSVDFAKKALRLANWLKVDAYLYIPGAVDVFFNPHSEVIPYDVCYKRAKEALRKVVPTAESMGVTLGVENVWNKFLLSPLEMRDFVDGFKSKRVGVYFDVGNVLLTGYPDQWIRILGRRIVRVHVKDFKRSVGTAAGFCHLTDGDVDFKAVRKALEAIKFKGFITAEVIPYAPGLLEKTGAAMRRLFK